MLFTVAPMGCMLKINIWSRKRPIVFNIDRITSYLELEKSKFDMIIWPELDLKLLREIRIWHKSNWFRPETDMIWPFSLKIYYFSILNRSKLFAILTQKWSVYQTIQAEETRYPTLMKVLILTSQFLFKARNSYRLSQLICLLISIEFQ